MILSAGAIRAAIDKGELSIDPFDESNLKSASYTFTLSSRLLIPKNSSCIDIGGEIEREEFLMGPEGYILNPGDFLLGFTAEHLDLRGKFACFLGARGSCAQAGLSVLLSSDFAEPDTDNPIILEIGNAGRCPIRITAGLRIVKGIFVPVIDQI